VKSHKDLIVWQKAMRLAADVYRWTSSFPKHERYGLASQLQRAAVSVAANIAEGHGRGATKDYLRFLSISQGSLAMAMPRRPRPCCRELRKQAAFCEVCKNH
jgi:hypothetical protein